jgi:hypothetical protein
MKFIHVIAGIHSISVLIPNSVEKECFGVDFSTQNSIDI